ncbi:MAG TPA: PilZ domain-containing protein [Terriglobales bacterium]|nr:PilZ domain-containing protein [Terriglobales bacterium]
MQTAIGTALVPIPPTKRPVARVALVDLKEPSRTLLSECFRQNGIDTVIVANNAADRLHREKFEACVLKFTPGVERLMEVARTSPSNSRIVIYGLGGNAQDAMRFSKYAVNAVFHEPLERQAALKLVRATRMLVTHEFRRYARVPVVTEVVLTLSDKRRFNATSLEISSGGMSLRSVENVASGQPIDVSFALLTLPRVTIHGAVSWKKAKAFGVRFDLLDADRKRLKSWVDAFLGS